MNLIRGAIALATLCIAVAPAAAETAAEKGVRIARAADAKDDGFRDTIVLGKMILRNRRGQESARDFRSLTFEVAGDGDKSVIVFDRPRDIHKTALLTHAHKNRDDDQWLYLPALKRVKRISSSNRSGSFVGSEFSYEDMSRQTVEKYTYRWLREEPCPGATDLTCHVNERKPTDQKSGFVRQVVWLDTAEYRAYKVDYYDRKLSLLKTMTARDYQRYEGRYWRPRRIHMSNHQTGKSTTLIWRNFRFGVGLTDLDFTKRALQRGISARPGDG
jgi:outer membrane lipoprotein-sorting protein